MGYGHLNRCLDSFKAFPEHICMLGVQNNRVWACINRTKVTNSPSMPKSSIWPCIYDMRLFYVLHSKNMLNILVFKKLDGFEQPWSSAIQNRAQKLKWINFRCLVCRVKLTTLPNHNLNPEAVCENIFFPYIYIYGKKYFSIDRFRVEVVFRKGCQLHTTN